jgi:hypothetical protein
MIGRGLTILYLSKSVGALGEASQLTPRFIVPHFYAITAGTKAMKYVID